MLMKTSRLVRFWISCFSLSTSVPLRPMMMPGPPPRTSPFIESTENIMPVEVETLEKLERRITLTLPATAITFRGRDTPVAACLVRSRADGFRPGKVSDERRRPPLWLLGAQRGPQRQGRPRLQTMRPTGQAARCRFPEKSPKERSPEGRWRSTRPSKSIRKSTSATWAAEVESVPAEVTDAEIDKTIDILRKQRRTFDQASGTASRRGRGDRVTVDFAGKIDGVVRRRQSRRLPVRAWAKATCSEFEAAVGLKVGESKTFPLAFPEDYHGKDVAGKSRLHDHPEEARGAHLPEVDAEFAKSLGIDDGTSTRCAPTSSNLEREVKFRVMARNKEA